MSLPSETLTLTARPYIVLLCSTTDGKITVSNAEVIEADVPARNGVIHVLNAVI